MNILKNVVYITLEYYSDLKKEILQYAVTWMNLEDNLLGEKFSHKRANTA